MKTKKLRFWHNEIADILKSRTHSGKRYEPHEQWQETRKSGQSCVSSLKIKVEHLDTLGYKQ